MAESNTILAAVDGFSMPATLSGWAIRWEDGSPVADLRIEALRDGLVIASTAPSGPRPDVTHTDDVNAAFTLDCPADVTVDDLMGGSVSLQAVDAAGEIAPVPIWGPIRDLMSRESMLRSLREAEAPLALDMLDALSSNRLLSPDIRGALKLAGKRATKGKGSASPGPKITFIGAGSTVFAKALIGDILLHPALSASRIYLYDIDQDRLRTSEIVASRICQAPNSPPQHPYPPTFPSH